jgi:hypothetical protein
MYELLKTKALPIPNSATPAAEEQAPKKEDMVTAQKSNQDQDRACWLDT